MDSTDEILKRFEERQGSRRERPAPLPPPPEPPPAKTAPRDEKSRRILLSAANYAAEMMHDFDSKSPEYAALYVLATFTREMVS